MLSTDAISYLQQGKVIAYPTEAVFGLGCDPDQPQAIAKILQMKRRSRDKGFILIAHHWEQLVPYIEPIAAERMEQIMKTWPGPYTWLFPAKATTSEWIRGVHSTVAVRVTAHPIAAELCRLFGKPLISSSANREGEPPARSVADILHIFSEEVDFVVEGKTGDLQNPTEIREAVSGTVIRPA